MSWAAPVQDGDDPIERIEPEGVRTRDGVLHRLDVLVLATGFQVDRFVRPIRVIGRDGSLTGYAGGVAIKRWLLAHEAAVGVG